MAESILEVSDLKVHYSTARGPIRAVEGITFAIEKGERFGLVGESGSGKTTSAFAMLRLIEPPGHIEGGRVVLDGIDLLRLTNEEMRKARFAQISLIPQGAMNSLNPVMRVSHQITDTIRAHGGWTDGESLDQRVADLLASVGLEPDVATMYPHELSGGMKQRVCIAMAISLSPMLIIADEPTSALDVVVQRQVMQTLTQVQERLGASIIFVGHDMGLMAQFVDRIGVMYAGKLVEIGPVNELFRDPQHPYTQLLIGSLPSLETKRVFKGIPGLPPSLLSPPPGCSFNPRCPRVMDHCSVDEPPLLEQYPRRWVACHLYGDGR